MKDPAALAHFRNSSRWWDQIQEWTACWLVFATNFGITPAEVAKGWAKMMNGAASDTAQRRTRVLWIVVVVLLLAATWPVVGRSHLEGFTYQTEVMSLMVGDLGAVDPLWQNSLDYFYLSRPATVWLMAPLSALSPGNGYNLLMWLALPFFLGGLLAVIRLWGQVSWLAAFATLLALPVAIDTQFFFNDNVIASACMLCGVALLLWSRSAPAVLLAGMCAAVALLCRLDQILLMPLFVVLAVIGRDGLRDAASSLVLLICGFASVQGVMWAVDPVAVDLLHRIIVVSSADGNWERSAFAPLRMLRFDFATLLLAFGVGLPAIIGGGIIVLQQTAGLVRARAGLFDRTLVGNLLLLSYPLAIYVVTFGKYYDPRGFMTMLPFLAPMAGMAIDAWIIRPLQAGAPSLRIWLGQHGAKFALLALPVLVPGVPLFHGILQAYPETENAPLSLTGRMWYGHDWRAWQDGYRGQEAAISGVLDAVPHDGQPYVVTSTLWNNDRMLQHAMVVAGYRPATVEVATCAPVAEVWSYVGGPTIYHVRTHVPFLPDMVEKTAALMVDRADDCFRAFPAERRISLTPFGAFLHIPLPDERITRDAMGLRRISDDYLALLNRNATATLEMSAEAGETPRAAASRIMQAADAALN